MEFDADRKFVAANFPDGRFYLVGEGEKKELVAEYQHKDHLGNVRVAFSDRNGDKRLQLLDGAAGPSEVTQINDYFPFGLQFPKACGAVVVPENRYQYNGKEWEEEFGLYDYGARYYDPAIGRWGAVDPLADQYGGYSPYNYVMGNPIKYIDPDGMRVDDIIDIEKRTGKITVTEAEGDDVIRLVDNGNAVDSYTYGENGSFQAENILIEGETSLGTEGTAIISTNGKAAQTLFEFAAQSDVEFGILDVSADDGSQLSIVQTSHESDALSTAQDLARGMSELGFTGIRQSHSHPDGNPVPSGHYGLEQSKRKNPYELTPIPNGGGDAKNARNTRKYRGFDKIRFDVYEPKGNTKTIYDGRKKAEILPRG